MTCNVEHVIDAAHDSDVAVFVVGRAVAGEIVATLELCRIVSVLVALGIAPYRTQHRWPWLLDDQYSAFTVTYRLPGFIDDIGKDAGQRKRGRTRLRWRNAGKRRDHVPAGFRLPPRVHDGATASADRFVVPHPRLGIDGLTDSPEDAQRAQIVLLRQVAARFDQRAYCGRRGIEHRHF